MNSNEDSATLPSPTTHGMGVIRTYIEARERRDLDRVATMWAKDGVLEYPYAPAQLAHLIPTRLETGAAIVERLRRVLPHGRAITNSIEALRPLEEPGEFLLEYSERSEMSSGQSFDAQFIALITIKDGQIALWREWFDPTSVLEAFGGLETDSDSSEASSSDKPAAVASNKATARTFLSVFSIDSEREALALLDDLIDEDFFFADQLLPEPIVGIRGAQEWVVAERRVFTNRSEQVEHMVGEGNIVMMSFRVQGHYSGADFLGLSNGKPGLVESSVLAALEFSDDGRIKELTQRSNGMSVLQQMGLLPAL